jgi:hypothetical protein
MTQNATNYESWKKYLPQLRKRRINVGTPQINEDALFEKFIEFSQFSGRLCVLFLKQILFCSFKELSHEILFRTIDSYGCRMQRTDE